MKQNYVLLFQMLFGIEINIIFFLSYIVGFDENQIPIKVRSIQMNQQILEYGKKDIQNLLDKNLIRKSHSPWNCVAFYVKKPLKIERDAQDL